MNNDDFTVLVSEGSRHTIEWARALCGCRIQNDWTSRAMNLHQILRWAWKFLRRNYCDDSEVHGYRQLVTSSFITTTHSLVHYKSCAVFGKASNHPGDSDPSTPQIWCPATPGFSKTKITFEREIQTVDEIQENTTGQLKAIGRTVWGPKVPTWKGTKALCTMFLVSSSINVSIFIVHGWILFQQTWVYWLIYG